jgi:protein-S-isoprenylcysteine O-methyltransferase Ste14
MDATTTTDAIRPTHVRKSRAQRWRIDASRAVVAVIVVVFAVTRSRWEDVWLASDLFFLAGVLLVGTATVGRIWCSLYIAGYKSKVLITEGPYSMCRNPLYFFSLLGCIGLGLTTETLSIPFVAAVAFIAYYPLVVRGEESRLLALHGEAFRAYRDATPRLIPSLRLLREPDHYPVQARVFRRSLLDALCFIWAIGLIEMVEALHTMGVVPTWAMIW